jgi:hypothetical protein
MDTPDRRALVLASSSINGIDFVEVANDQQTALRVHFLNHVPLAHTLASPPVVIAGGETIPTVAVGPINDSTAWSVQGRHLVLNLTVAAPGDFSQYTLTIYQKTLLPPGGPLLDPFFASSVFTFKAGCPSDLDCQVGPVVCPVPPSKAPPIDNLAKDFLSFRQALLDFSALRYPEWQERSEADFGVMFLEAICALADDLSYTQDRIAAEAALETATQRRSIVRHARLVDYEPQPALAASVLLQLEVSAGPSIAPGLVVSAQGPDGTSIDFETGNGLVDLTTGQLNTTPFPVSPLWNRWKRPPGGSPLPNLLPYVFDASQSCLQTGATELWIRGHGFGFTSGQLLLIDTPAAVAADAPVRELVELAFPPGFNPEEFDELRGHVPLTHLIWRAVDALKADHDLSRTQLAGNLVPATQGRRQTETFVMDQPPPATPDMPRAVVRTGPNQTVQYLYTLGRSPLAWLAGADPTTGPLPEIQVMQQAAGPSITTRPWIWQRTLLTAEGATPVFTMDRVRFRPTGIRAPDGSPIQDYDGDAGDSLRFGDGTLGEAPESGSVFQVTYRVGGGAQGNLAADSITRVSPAAAARILSATNPFAATGGADEEPNDQVRRRAPQAFRAGLSRAVLPADYQAVAETLSWVQRAGTVCRWTGSWLTVFTTPDPLHSEEVTVAQRTQLIDLLNRNRMAGYESYVPDPNYIALDLLVEVCALPDAFQGDVEQAVLTALGAASGGFFNPDNFTFGQALQGSALEAAVQAVPGVAGVLSISYRVRGRTRAFVPMGDMVNVAVDQIIRCDNDPSRPERGTLQVIVEGGK